MADTFPNLNIIVTLCCPCTSLSPCKVTQKDRRSESVSQETVAWSVDSLHRIEPLLLKNGNGITLFDLKVC